MGTLHKLRKRKDNRVYLLVLRWMACILRRVLVFTHSCTFFGLFLTLQIGAKHTKVTLLQVSDVMYEILVENTSAKKPLTTGFGIPTTFPRQAPAKVESEADHYSRVAAMPDILHIMEKCTICDKETDLYCEECGESFCSTDMKMDKIKS